MPGMDDYQLKYDEQGRPYYQFPGQPRNYVSPVAMGGQKPEDETGIFHKAPQWNNKSGEWETPFDWGNLLNIGVGAGLGLGGLHAAGVFGGGAAGSAGTYIPGAEAGALPPSLAAENAGVFLTPGGYAAGAGAGAGAAAGAAGGAAGSAKNLFGIPDWLRDALGIGIAGTRLLTGGGAKAHIPNPYKPPEGGGAPSAGGGANPGQQGLEGALGVARGRVDQSEPLFKALMTMAQAGLPDYAKGQGNG